MGLALSLAACPSREVVGPLAPPEPTLDEPIGLSTQEQNDLDARLQTLEERLQDAMQEHHVPGLAIAVVKDDAVVYAKGLGLADIEANEPVTPETLFAIGSSTKAFTAVLAGLLEQEGKLKLDDPLTKYVPEFALNIDGKKGDQATLRDALSHQTGFTRMSLLWIGGALSRPDLLAAASKAEPWAKHRERFLYNNVTYAAVGEATARAADTTWDELLRVRLFGPLGMTDSTSSYEQARDDERRAQGYVWKDGPKSYKALPMRSLDPIAPAGGITSNVLDMSKWVRMLLAEGELDGQEIVPESVIEEVFEPHIPARGSEYGLGWFVASWQGKTVLHHGGNIDGYAAQVGLMPSEELGFVLLTNVSHTPLQQAVLDMVWDSLLGEPTTTTSGTSEDLSPFVGTYIADFGPFDEAGFEVTEQGGTLFVDIPGQMNVPLRPPGEDGRRPLAVGSGISVSFEGADDGEAEVMRLHQGGLDFELFREGYQPPVEIPLVKLEPFLGQYHHDKLGEVQVVIRHGRLAVDIPKQMVYELHPPGEDGKWAFRVKPDIVVSFDRALDAEKPKPPGKMELHQDGKTEVLERRGGPRPLPSLASLDKVRRPARIEAALKKLGELKTEGTVRSRQTGIEGRVSMRFGPDGEAHIEVDFGDFGSIETELGPDRAITVTSFAPRDEAEGDKLRQAQLGHPLTLARDWKRSFDEVRVVGRTKVGDTETVLVELRAGELPPYEIAVDPKTGDVLQLEYAQKLDSGGLLPTTIRFEDYRRVPGGLRLPFRTITRNDPEGETILQLTKIGRL